MKNRYKLLVLLSLLLVPLVIFSRKQAQANLHHLNQFYNARMSPVIMLPGSSATENRFDQFVAKINRQSVEKHSLLKVKAWNNGKITYQGSIRNRDEQPFIVVGFENNHDGYRNILKQAALFEKVFADLQGKYSFNNFKGIGHSNGGLIYTAFLEKYFNQFPDVQIKKLMTIGTPYNFNEPSTKKQTQMLANFVNNRVNLPTSLIVYSVAGTKTYDSDGLVPEGSVTAGKYIYQKQVQQFTQITVTGEDAQHSDLPQNDEIISLVQRYIIDPPARFQRKGR